MTPLVFLHGWGQSARIWHEQLVRFSLEWPVSMLNLPGHGGAVDAPAPEWGNVLLAQMPTEPAVIIGWSLGGMLATELARMQPQRVAGLALVSTTPCFCNRPGWDAGCADSVFRDFELGVQENSARAMGRFFALMLHGDALSRPEYNAITRVAADRGHPASTEGLRQGLSLLGALDLRHKLTGIEAPCLVMHGEADAVVPLTAGEYLAGHIPKAAFERFAKCGHAPFLTQAGKFNQRLEDWCRNVI